MNIQALTKLLADDTVLLRTGEAVREEVHATGRRTAAGGLRVITIDAMPHKDEANKDRFEVIDMILCAVGVDREKAKADASEFKTLLAQYPQLERLAGGPSYIEVGGELGSQEYAFRLFAFGKVAGLWKVITPATMHITDPEQARELAGRGFVMMSGWRPDEQRAP